MRFTQSIELKLSHLISLIKLIDLIDNNKLEVD